MFEVHPLVITYLEVASASNMNAIDTEGNRIPGLYVVGNDSGAYFANQYPNLSCGMAAGRTVTFGRHVGRYLAKL